MIYLFVDTSLSYIRLALVKDNILLASVNEYCDKDLSKKFITYVQDLFEKNSINYKDINKIFCVTGPGSFTGIRVGMTFVKVLAWSFNIDIVPISELQVLATLDIDTDYILPLIDARRGYVYSGIYDKELNAVVSDRYILLDEILSSFEHKKITIVSHDQFANLNVMEPEINFIKIICKNEYKDAVNAHTLTPNYLKKTEAEENLKKKIENDNKI